MDVLRKMIACCTSVSTVVEKKCCYNYGSRLQNCTFRCCRYSWRSCAARCTKVLLVLINFVFLACGVSLVVIGFWVYIDQQSFIYTEILHGIPAMGPLLDFEKIPAVFICIGSFVSLLSFLGCCGACSESVCFLSLYSILLFLVLSAQVVTSVLIVVYQNRILHNLESSMQRQITFEYNKTAKPSNQSSMRTNHVTATWDILQIKFNCCGATGPTDYKFSSWFNNTHDLAGDFVPPSCCILLNDDYRNPQIKNEDKCQIEAIVKDTNTKAISSDKTPSGFLKPQGCQKSFIRWLRPKIVTVIAITTTTAILQVVHFVFACVLLAALRRSHRDCRWYEDECD